MATKTATAAGDRAMVPLAVLLKRELTSEKIEKPDILHGLANQSKKGEDFTFLKVDCQRVPGDDVTTFSVFALFDGHNGSGAAIYAKENLLNNIISAIPSDLTRDEWLSALPRALVAGFVKTDKDFQTKSHTSGTTVTFVIIDGWVVTVASVGDSRCILESAEGTIYYLSADHRLDVNEEEVRRVTASGGEVGRLNIVGGAEVGPLRCWPGGLCLSRSIGDMDVGEFIVPIPHVKQVKLSNAGGRIIISSDGVWDVLTAEMAISCSLGLSANSAAAHIVKEAVQLKGLRDDTTCIVVDLLPPEKITPSAPLPKKQGMGVFKNMFRRKSCESSSNLDREFSEPDVVEEIFEDGSACLAQRLEMEYPIRNLFKLFICAICQVEMKPGEGISVHTDSTQLEKVRPWDGPFLCSSCQDKKAAMEGKKSSRGMRTTQRAESINAFFDEFVNANTSLSDFVQQYDKAIQSHRGVEEREDFHTMNSNPVYLTHNPLEVEAGKIYTQRVFCKFQQEYTQAFNFYGAKIFKDSGKSFYSVYLVGGVDEGKSIVEFSNDEGIFIKCSCKKYEQEGIFCCHILTILHKKGVGYLPEQYILHRWTINARYSNARSNHLSTLACNDDDLTPLENLSWQSKAWRIQELGVLDREYFDFGTPFMDDFVEKFMTFHMAKSAFEFRCKSTKY